MGVGIWGNVKSSDMIILREGNAVSVATVDGTPPTLRWKREAPNLSWPSDAASLQIATLDKVQTFVLIQLRGGDAPGSVLITNCEDLAWRTKNTDPQSSDDFEVVTLIS